MTVTLAQAAVHDAVAMAAPQYDAVLYGELTADGRDIALVAEGNAWGLDQVAGKLKRLTPLLRTAELNGVPVQGVYCPATWPAVVQLGFTFSPLPNLGWVPGPRLTEWITEETIRRTSPPPEPARGWPPGTELRPYQLLGAAEIADTGRFLLLDDPGPQPVTTPAWTPDGWVPLGELVPGDVVYDLHGRQVPVRAVKHFGAQAVWRVTFSDGSSTLATGTHRWRVWTKNDRRRHSPHGRVLSTDQIRESGLHYAGREAKFFLPQQPVLDVPEHALPLDPYAYGALLGNGSLGCTDRGHPSLSIAGPDDEILLSVAAAATALGTTWRWNRPANRCQSLSFRRKGRLAETLAGLDALKYSEDKHVAPVYLRGGTVARRALLAGLLDTDGSVTNRGAGVEFSSASPQLAADVAWLARSLGAVVTEAKPQPAGYIREDGIKVRCLLRHRLHMRFPADGPNPFTLPRKADAWTAQAARVQRRNPPRSFVTIEPAGTAPVCCIELDTDDPHARVYLTDTALIPTHNTGKTCVAICGVDARRLAGHEIFPVLVVVPSWVVADHWAHEITKWAPGWGEPVMYGGTGRGHKLTGAQAAITTYATLRRDAADMRGPLPRWKPATVIADEIHLCAPHDTLITVPGGVKTICNIRPGDLVRGVDHSTGQVVWTPVHQVMRSPLRPVTRIPQGPALTPEHPVWVSYTGSLCYDNGYGAYPVRVLPEAIPAQAENQPVLLPELHGESILGAARSPRGSQPANTGASSRAAGDTLSRLRGKVPAAQQGKARRPEDLLPVLQRPEDRGTAGRAGSPQENHAADHQAAGRPGTPGRLPDFGPEPVPGPGRTGESTGNPGRAGLGEPERRQWPGAYYPAGDVACLARAWLDHGTDDQDRHEQGLRLPAGVQGGYRAPGAESGDRGARHRARENREPAGSQEAGLAGIPGLDGAVDLERADPGRSLWNLETGTGNYFADGVLVHNCRNKDAKQTRALLRVARHADTVVGASGTPVTRNTGDVHPLLEAMDRRSWPDRERLTNRFCEKTPDDYGEKILGLNPLAAPEFFACLMRSMRRVAKADVLDQLPPKIYSVRRPVIPPEWEHAYRTMERDMLAELPDGGELPVMSTLAKLTRLSQLASAAADVEVTEELDERTGLIVPKYHVTLKPPSWKAESLLGILAERPGKPVVAFTESRQLAMITGRKYCEASGLRTGYVTGTGDGITHKTRQRAVEDFQAGKLDVIVCTAGAGGLGITLTAADTCVMLQRPYQYDIAVQPEDRVHRIGAEIHAHVEIIDIVAQGTVDERRRTVLRDKAGMLGEFVRDPRVVRELLGGIP
jgi:hypothetical protein